MEERDEARGVGDRVVKAHLALTGTAAHLAVLPVKGVHEQSQTLRTRGRALALDHKLYKH